MKRSSRYGVNRNLRDAVGGRFGSWQEAGDVFVLGTQGNVGFFSALVRLGSWKLLTKDHEQNDDERECCG